MRYDETKDHVDLLENLDAVDPPRMRALTLAHYGADADQETFAWKVDGSLVIGRDPGEGGAELLDPGSSRRHAEIVYDKKSDAYRVRDLGSRNGTYVDGARLTAEVPLHHGAVIRIADSMFVYADVPLPEGLPRPALEPEIAPARAVVEERADLGAPSELTVLILGPTGAGKEVMAKRVHDGSGRKGKLVAVNCGSLNRELIASELFGHVAGAFSGANQERSGLFVAADGGTLFLDEIADLPLDQQPSLLRTLQEKRVRPVGSDKETPVNVRVVAATHKPLRELVEAEQFRRDLFARLSGFVLDLPGLEDRREEILPFFSDLSGIPPHEISADAAEALLLHDWPQNVREVQHLAAQVKMFPREGALELTALPAHFSENITQRRKAKPKAAVDPDKLDKAGLEALLVEHKGNVATIAKAFGKHRAQVYRWLKREGLNPDDYRPAEEE